MSIYSGYEKRKKFGEAVEKAFVKKCRDKKILCYKYENNSSYDRTDRVVRNAPDFILLFDKECSTVFFEVKGGGNKIHLKIKDFESYEVYNNTLTLLYFFYFSVHKKFKIISHNQLKNIVSTCEQMTLPYASKTDDKMAYIIPYELFK